MIQSTGFYLLVTCITTVRDDEISFLIQDDPSPKTSHRVEGQSVSSAGRPGVLADASPQHLHRSLVFQAAPPGGFQLLLLGTVLIEALTAIPGERHCRFRLLFVRSRTWPNGQRPAITNVC